MRRWIGLLLICAASFAAFEVNGDGAPVDFTKIGSSARFWGMGKAGVALANDSGALLLNPASMALAHSLELSAMHTQTLGVSNYTLFNGVLPFNNKNLIFGFSFIHEDAGTIYETNGLDANGYPLKGGTIDNSNVVASLGFGGKLSLFGGQRNTYLGLLLKNHQRHLGELTAGGTALDLGVIYRLGHIFSLGLNVRNAWQSGLNYSVSERSGFEHYPTEYVAGFALTMLDNNLMLALDKAISETDSKTYFGLEYIIAETVSLRSGLADKDMTLGLGLRLVDLQFDVGYRYQDAPLDNQLYFSITYGNARSLFMDVPTDLEIIDAPRAEPEKIVVYPPPVEPPPQSTYNDKRTNVAIENRPEEITL
ncbi:hypothetical protein NO2_0293 [Candidatus Termititenax persephonae]|uniref:PorV/PorQ family protein n=1 Tax=Candidatus Termititenax persephonae TaxID=2218525 RepID=A0A388TFV7_9BACT|nr:hypothetical protein NO2_0293 [Candidatus Termititenax persephonae]